MIAALGRARLALFSALVLAASAAPASASGAWGEVVLVEGDRVYVARRDSTALDAGRRAILRRGEVVLDTLQVEWARDAIVALRRTASGAPTVVSERESLAVEPLFDEPPFVPPAGVLRVPLGAAPAVLDPLYLTTLAEKQVASQMFDGLVRLDADLAPRPALARGWTTAGLVTTFHLRPDAVFPGGRPLRAVDVTATLARALAPGNGAPRVEGLAAAIAGGEAYRAGRAPRLAGVRAVDSLTVAITAARPGARLLAELAAPAAFLVTAGVPPRPMTERELLGAQSGPFRLTGVTDRVATLLAAPGRAGGPASLDFVRVAGPSEAAIEFELGRLDLVAPPEAIARRLQGGARRPPTEIAIDEVSTYYLGFDTRRPFVAERAHRRALAGLVDRALAVRVLVPGRGRLAAAILPPVFGVDAPPESTWRMPRGEAERAARGGFGGRAPALSFWVPTGSEVGLRLAEYVASTWRRSGVKVTVVERPWAEFQEGIAAGEADAFYLSWFADGPDAASFLASMLESTRRGDGGNRTHYASEAVDQALDEARRAATDPARDAALRRAERLALADAPLLPLFHSVNVTLVRPGVSGLVLDPLGAPRYDAVRVP